MQILVLETAVYHHPTNTNLAEDQRDVGGKRFLPFDIGFLECQPF